VLERKRRRRRRRLKLGGDSSRRRSTRRPLSAAISASAAAAATVLLLLFQGSEGSSFDVWDVYTKLEHAPKNLPFTKGMHDRGAQALRLLTSTWGVCQSTIAFVVTTGFLSRSNMDLSHARLTNKCGPSIAHICHFQDVATFSAKLGVHWSPVPGDEVAGFFLLDSMWKQLDSEVCSDLSSFQRIKHPARSNMPNFDLPQWLLQQLDRVAIPACGELMGRSYVKVGDDSAKEACSQHLVEEMLTATVDIWRYSVKEVWAELYPALFAGEQPLPSPFDLLVVGCATLESDPVSPLLDLGAGGLFLDADRHSIRVAQQKWARNRRILNATVHPGTFHTLLAKHAEVLQNVQVLQVDIDSMDGPVVMKALEHFAPTAVVVELREVVPFPFRHACQTTNTRGVARGGANLNYWRCELGIRGYTLFAMDTQDAVFVRSEKAQKYDAFARGERWRFLGMLGAYLRQVIATLPPSAFFLEEPAAETATTEHDRRSRQRNWFHWLAAAEPHGLLESVWKNLTDEEPEIPFLLML